MNGATLEPQAGVGKRGSDVRPQKWTWRWMSHQKRQHWRPWSRLYERVLLWSGHRRAPVLLAVLSFAESSFFPVPPDVMLAPMCLARPRKAWALAGLCTISSVFGGLFGYLLGRWAFASIQPWVLSSQYAELFHQAVAAFEKWGVVYILLAGFTPIPYKIFTISAGVVGMPFLPFLAGSAVGRGGRFFLVAGIIRMLGDRGAERLRSWVDTAGWLLLLLVALSAAGWWILRSGASV